MTSMLLPDLGESWNARDADRVADVYASGAVRIEFAMPGARLEGREAIREHARMYVEAVPDCVLEIRHAAVATDGTATIEWIFRGTHVRDLPGLPARGEEFSLDGVSVCSMREGRIAEERVYWDSAALMAAAGVLG